jgi:hypothetical protein
VINSTLLSAATARTSARTSSRKNSRSFSRSPSTVKLFPVEKRSCTTALAAISPTLSPFGRNWLMGNKRELRVQAEVSDDRAQPLGINVGVARRCRDALMAEERLDVAQVGSPLVEKESRAV